ncbi:hypothetical protein GTCCBUS3UF5_3990 [Geobacillus thermoleovorans CCB_US3_UF5]|uniref:Uncharacterized protein n=2 Tax=Geobacillus thermoleovorans group TaxID=1505648 RepID=U2Y6Q6_GEOKU|nr:hypothetical protein GTCCBUS3UF5_3990 [Geobacillus thermoleovorans CCB_US3_UF5]GAD15079.1 hypothetical protein GBL_3296 [Geobacillus kaustophilus GBlys]GAJ60340.1 hypothetical protein B23_3585 [Geobacillus thermoleovorans B23]
MAEKRQRVAAAWSWAETENLKRFWFTSGTNPIGKPAWSGLVFSK